MIWPLIMHVNYCEQGQSLDQIFKKASSWGFEGVELRRKRNNVKENPEEYLENASKAARMYGIKQVIFGGPGPNFMAADAAVRERELEEAISFFRLASGYFKLTVCNTFSGNLVNPAKGIPGHATEMHGSFIAREEHWRWAVENFKVLGTTAEELGFKLAFETHMGYVHDLPDTAMKLVDMIANPAVGVNLDFGNIVYSKENSGISNAISTIGCKLYYVHLKNSVAMKDGSRYPTGLGEGEINHREYLRLLKKSGYRGPLCIEAPRSGDREWYAQKDLEYIRSVIMDLEEETDI